MVTTEPHRSASAAAQPAATARSAPRLTIGLPVYNGERYLAESLDALLAQTYQDFEIVISDNASTDRTAEICTAYAARDERIRYIRQQRNVGASANHNLLVDHARGEYFKWASHDDLYAPDLLLQCIRALDADPGAVLAHADEAYLDEHGELVAVAEYRLDTTSPDPAVRLRSLLHTLGGDDFYGVIRTDVLRRIRPHDSYHNADRVFTAELVLAGRFQHVPELLYYRRDHPDRAERRPTVRGRAANLDPRRGSRWRHPELRLHVEYIAGFLGAVRHADLSRRDRMRCAAAVGTWLARRLRVGPPTPGEVLDPALRAKVQRRERVRLPFRAVRRRSESRP